MKSQAPSGGQGKTARALYDYQAGKFVESAERNHWYRYTIRVFVLQLYLECVFQLNFCLNLYYFVGTVNWDTQVIEALKSFDLIL